MNDRKNRRLNVRCTAEQFAAIDAAATRAGLSLGAFLRTLAFGSPGPRAVRRPPVEIGALARLLGQIGKLGGNVNSLAHRAHVTNDLPRLRELTIIKRDVAVLRAATMQALGRHP